MKPLPVFHYDSPLLFSFLKTNRKILCILVFSISLSFISGQSYTSLTDTRDGHVYKTIKIGNQWWMAENLNYGTRITGTTNQTNNATIEKYCYDNNELNCDTFGALYQRNELLKYSSFPVNQGICPAGWHVPSDVEWKEMEMYLGMDQGIAESNGWRGTDEGNKLKKNGISGFEANFEGFRSTSSSFSSKGIYSYFWTADNYSRYIGKNYSTIYRAQDPDVNFGFSLRCVKNTVVLTDQVISYTPNFINSLDYNWADYDNDNDLDLLVTSNDMGIYSYTLMGQQYTKLFRNNGSGYFTKTDLITDSAGLSSAAWGDYDLDGDLDIIISGIYKVDIIDGPGLTIGFRRTRIYENRITSFVAHTTQIEDLCWSSVAFEDFDKDGDPDVIICGDRTFNTSIFRPVTQIYRNDGDNYFTNLNLDIKGVAMGNISCFDYDKNGYPDFLITGYDQNHEAYSAIYKNNSGFDFTEIKLNIEDVSFKGNNWMDFNNDGDYDIVTRNVLYKNMGADSFMPVDTFNGIETFGDLNNDGYIDIVTSEAIYLNDGYENYYLVKNVETQQYSCADINNDNNIDLIGKNRRYLNIENKINTKPTVPDNLNVNFREGNAILKWRKSIDKETPQEDLTYNVRMGTSSTNENLVSSGSNLSNGYRRLPQSGNISQNDSLVIKGGGMYYWQVQAIDNNYLASEFSATNNFILPGIFSVAEYFSSNINLNWGDYNNDSKMDYESFYFYTGGDSISFYSNTGSYNFNIDARLKVNNPDGIKLHWSDFDNDNDIDLIGVNTNIIIQNNNNGENFSLLSNIFPVEDGYELLGIKDMDNDGDADYLITSDFSTKIFFKESSAFTEYNIENFYCDSVIIFDYDNDSDNDIFNRNTGELLENNGYRTFTRKTLPVIPYGLCFDFDNDGDIDVLNNNLIYINEDNEFTESITEIRKLYPPFKQLAGDYDNDGDYDIVLVGEFGSSAYHGLYINDGKASFTEDTYFSELNDGEVSSSLIIYELTDFDNDDDLDFSYTYQDPDVWLFNTPLYSNNFNKPNNKSSAPKNLKSSKLDFGIKLSWEAPDDVESKNVLCYNLRIGTFPGGTDIMSPASNLVTGDLLITGTSNVSNNLFWRSDSLKLGTYYWSVQAVDHGLKGGEWTAEQTFEISRTIADFTFDTVCRGTPTSFTDKSVTMDLVTGYYWLFGDGTFSSEKNPKHIYEESGTFRVVHRVYSITEDIFEQAYDVIIKPSPVAEFDIEPVCLGETSHFTNKSDTVNTNVIFWQWDFGNGRTSSFRGNESQIYGQTDTVTLSLAGQNGCSNSISKPAIVAEIPVAVITSDGSLTICGGSTVELSVDHDENYTYQWKIDGADATEGTENIYTAEHSGAYSVNVSNVVPKCNSSDTVIITVVDKPPTPVISSEGSLTVCPGEAVKLSVEQFSNSYNYQWKRNEIPLEGKNSEILSGNIDDGVYTIEAGAGNCISISNALTVSYLPAPEKPFIYTNDGPVLYYLECSNRNADEYQWYYNGVALPGANKYNYIAEQNLGKYIVEIKEDNYTCKIKSNEISIPPEVSGLTEITDENDITVYPNPNSGKFRISLKDEHSQIDRIEVYNMMGKLIFLEIFEDQINEFEFNLSEISPGIYSIVINADNSVYYKKTFIQE